MAGINRFLVCDTYIYENAQQITKRGNLVLPFRKRLATGWELEHEHYKFFLLTIRQFPSRITKLLPTISIIIVAGACSPWVVRDQEATKMRLGTLKRMQHGT